MAEQAMGLGAGEIAAARAKPHLLNQYERRMLATIDALAARVAEVERVVKAAEEVREDAIEYEDTDGHVSVRVSPKVWRRLEQALAAEAAVARGVGEKAQ